MKFFKFLLSLAFTLGLIYALDNRWEVANTPIPALGKFLDPFHGFWQNAESRSPFESGELSLEGLKAPVTVIYDSLLIPHIFASNDEDLYLAQGYITARFRLWQMEFQTHAAAGRIAEILGPGPNDAVLGYDRGQRRLGMLWSARAQVEEFNKDPITKMVIDQYTAGVNQYIRSLSYKDLPLEYKLLGYEPEEWSPLKCALMHKNLAQTLNDDDKDLEMTNALNLFGPDIIELLYPDREPVGDPIVDNPGGWNFDPIIIPDSIQKAIPKELIYAERVFQHNPNTGSNNWAVSGARTATGSPILCNDPHLDTSLPSIWFAIQLQAPGINCMGVSAPGLPDVIIGFNDSIAWGLTNAQRDLVDWYRIQFQNEKKENYLLDSQWVSTTKVVEEIKVRGKETFFDTVVYTKWGPVTFDESYRGQHELAHYAYRWLSHDPSNETLAIHKLNRARNYNDYLEAADLVSAPAQNLAFASASGDIAIRVQGKYPVRRKYEGKFVLDGSNSQHGWQDFIPNEQNVIIKNPERGFVSSANQYPADSTYPYYITATSYEAYRNRRINQVLASDSSATIDDMMKLQNDNFNLKAAESLPLFLNYIDSMELSGEEQQVAKILKSWDYQNDKDSEAASYYEAWWDRLMPTIWDEMRNVDARLRFPTTWNTINLIKTSPDFNFFDVVSTPEKETAKEVIQFSFRESVKNMAKWKTDNQQEQIRWADYKDTYIEHLTRLSPFSFHVQHGGNHDIVNASTRKHGPSWRMIVSLEKSRVNAYAVYPGGQSGNPGSAYYSSMIDHWANGRYFKLMFFQQQADDNKKAALFTTEIKPSK